jgi:N-acetylneuraminic acid mutarotase
VHEAQGVAGRWARKVAWGGAGPAVLVSSAGALIGLTGCAGPTPGGIAERPRTAPPVAAAARPGQDDGRWQAGAALPVQIAEIAAAALDGAVYTGGGFTPPGGAVGTWFGRYDVAADTWRPLAELPVAVHHPGLAAADGRLWLAGGYLGGFSLDETSRSLHVYDPGGDRWQRRADMPGRRAAHGLAALDGRLYLAGGVGDRPDRMWVYDIAADRWSEVAGPIPREHLGVTAANGRVYVLAGRGFGRGIVPTAEAYDPALGSWSRLADMPGGCGGCSAAATADGRLHITGGEGGGRTYNDHYVYDPATAAWRAAAPMTTPRHGIGAAAVGERFFVVGGGRTQGLAYSDLLEWWAPASPTAGATGSPSASPPRASATPFWALFTPLVGGAWRR